MSTLREVLAAQRRAVGKSMRRMTGEQRREMLRRSREVEARLVREFDALGLGSLEGQQLAVRLLQAQEIVTAVGRELGEAVGDVLVDLGTKAARKGRELLIDQVEAAGATYKGTVRAINNVPLAETMSNAGLLERYASSVEFYGSAVIKRGREALTQAALGGADFRTAENAVVEAMQITGYRAERIVRTEWSYSLHRTQIVDLQQSAAVTGTRWVKKLVATFDDRTGDDSKAVHGQVRGLDEEFEDDKGRRYQHPPNRPNDREVVAYEPVLPGLGEFVDPA